MISNYLNLLYSNCISLSKSSNHDSEAVAAYFTEELRLIIQEKNLNNEAELFESLLSKPFNELNEWLTKNPLIKIFYLVNSLGEYNSSKESVDELGRFKYDKSAQIQTDVTNNLVWELIQQTLKHSVVLASNFNVNSQKSYFFLSHDIDSLYGSLLQDGLWALKKGRFDVLFGLFANVIIAKPHWFNIDLIMDLESEHDFKSTFFWLVNKGKIDQRQTNSDYSIDSNKLVKTLKRVEERGFENGLHKSISNESFRSELDKLPIKVKGNRYHYLKFQLPQLYDTIEESGLNLDASLGFAEHYGFRNNYGYPFSPYNCKTGKPYSFLEVPLTIMDGTFQRYKQLAVNKTADTIINFFEKNKHNSLISVLWHNTFFTNYKYKGYKEEYIKLLQYLHEEKFNNINQSGIIDLFKWKK